MTDDEAKQHLAAILARRTPGSVLVLLGDVLAERAAGEGWAADDPRHDRLATVVEALFVVGLGVDAARP